MDQSSPVSLLPEQTWIVVSSKLARGEPILPTELQALLRFVESAFAMEKQCEAAVQRAKLAALKEFAYGASHELNNPLANISTRAQLLLAEEQHPERRRKLAQIITQAQRAHEMISDLMLFAKPPASIFAPTLLRDIVDNVVGKWRSPCAESQIELDVAVNPPDVSGLVDRTQIEVALSAMVQNAIEAQTTGGQIEIKVWSAGPHLHIRVSDAGPGLDDRAREHLFDPFFSGREAGRGLGFGLAKAWRIVELHGGTIEVRDRQPRGSEFTIRLPLRSE